MFVQNRDPLNGFNGLDSAIEIGQLSECSLEIKRNTKDLYAGNTFPITTADVEGEISLTAKAAMFYANAFNLVLGGISTPGGNAAVTNETGTVSTTGKVQLAQSAAYVQGTAVVWEIPKGGGSAVQLTAIYSGNPVAGQSFKDAANGTLSFSTNDSGATVLVSYQYQVTGKGGQQNDVGVIGATGGDGAVPGFALSLASQYVRGSAVVTITPTGGGVTPIRYTLLESGSATAGATFVDDGSGELIFASGDIGAAINVTYSYSNTSGFSGTHASSGQTISIPNSLQNSSLGAQVTLTNQSLNRSVNQESTFILKLNQVILSGLKLDFKTGDWTIPDYTMKASADQAGQIGTAYFYAYDAN